MNRMLVVAVACTSFLAFAEPAKTKEEAQKMVDEGMAKSCTMAKDAITKAGDVCADEQAKVGPVDCANKDSRKSVDFLKLNGECQKKVAGKAKSDGEAAKKALKEDKPAEKKDEKAEKKDEKAEEKKADAKPADAATGTVCKAMDASGATVAEVTSDGTPIKCSSLLRDKLKAEKCEAGKKLEFQVLATWKGKEQKPSTTKITCPKK